MLTVEDLSCFYAGKPIYERLSFQLQAGECLYLTGSNGSGKSSLLKQIAGLHHSTTGSIQRSQPFAYLGHQLPIKPYQTTLQHIHFWAKIYNASIASIQTHPLLASLPFSFWQQEGKYLSAGQKQRLFLSITLEKSSSKLFLLDEPLANLDTSSIDILSQEIEKKQKQGASFLIATHQAFSKTLISSNTLLMEKYLPAPLQSTDALNTW